MAKNPNVWHAPLIWSMTHCSSSVVLSLQLSPRRTRGDISMVGMDVMVVAKYRLIMATYQHKVHVIVPSTHTSQCTFPLFTVLIHTYIVEVWRERYERYAPFSLYLSLLMLELLNKSEAKNQQIIALKSLATIKIHSTTATSNICSTSRSIIGLFPRW